MRRSNWLAAVLLPAVLLHGGPLAAQRMPTPAELRVSFEEFKKLYDKGDVLVLDVRGRAAYRAGHIPGAVSLPLDEVEARIPQLKKEKRPIVTYCT